MIPALQQAHARHDLIARLRSRAAFDGKVGLAGGTPPCQYDADLFNEAAAALDTSAGEKGNDDEGAFIAWMMSYQRQLDRTLTTAENDAAQSAWLAAEVVATKDTSAGETPQGLPKRTATELAYALRVRASCLTGEKWEATATADMMREAADLLSPAATQEMLDEIWCPQCGGPNARADTDGCCVQCGATLLSDDVVRSIRAGSPPEPASLSASPETPTQTVYRVFNEFIQGPWLKIKGEPPPMLTAFRDGLITAFREPLKSLPETPQDRTAEALHERSLKFEAERAAMSPPETPTICPDLAQELRDAADDWRLNMKPTELLLRAADALSASAPPQGHWQKFCVSCGVTETAPDGTCAACGAGSEDVTDEWAPAPAQPQEREALRKLADHVGCDMDSLCRCEPCEAIRSVLMQLANHPKHDVYFSNSAEAAAPTAQADPLEHELRAEAHNLLQDCTEALDQCHALDSARAASALMLRAADAIVTQSTYYGALAEWHKLPLADRLPEWMLPGSFWCVRLSEADVNTIRAALSAPAPSQGWQPIETAPKGTMILVCSMKAMEARDWCFVDWLVNGKLCAHPRLSATHWMKLPERPQ